MRSKGKVERGVGYVRQNFWVRVGHEIRAGTLELGGLNERARSWTAQVANQRVHGTHGAVVWERYQEEAPLLGQLAGRPHYDTAYHALRRVSRDGRLSYKGVLYQVPLRQALREVLVDEHLDGAVTIRARDGALLPVVPVVPVADPPALTPVPRPPARPVAESVGAGMGPLLLVARGALPVVPLRELAVYEQVAREEVARAAGLG